MALFPCDANGHRYSGPQRTMYPAIVDGQETSRRKLRLCGKHFELFLHTLEATYNNAQLELEQEVSPACVSCGKDVDGGSWQSFVTSYDVSDYRRDWWGLVHSGCVGALSEYWRLTE